MRKLLLLVPCLLLAGCPYESEVPWSAPAAPDARLLGSWIQTLPTGQSGFAEIDVLRFNEREFYAESRSHEPYRPSETSRWRVYFGEIRGRSLMTLMNLDGGKFLFGSYALDDAGGLALSLMGGDSLPQKLKDSKALRAYVEAHVGDKNFFETPVRFQRRTSDKQP